LIAFTAATNIEREKTAAALVFHAHWFLLDTKAKALKEISETRNEGISLQII